MGTGRPALELLQKMGAPPSKLVNFPIWIDLNLYRRPPRIRLADKTLIFLSCGRLENSVKGHDLAIRAFALADGERAASFEYRIAGAGPDAEALRQLADELGLCDRFKLLGWLDPAELIKEMRTADVLIHPSPIHEPYGVAVIEAMAAEMVVLASDVTCAALDRVDTAVNGYIHRAGDFRQLAAQIRGLLADYSTIARMSAAAGETADHFPMSKGVALLKQIVEGSFQP